MTEVLGVGWGLIEPASQQKTKQGNKTTTKLPQKTAQNMKPTTEKTAQNALILARRAIICHTSERFTSAVAQYYEKL